MLKVTKDRNVRATKDYRLFGRSSENRVTDLKKHRRLEKSMMKYGFLACYPIVCYRDANKNLIVKDGQHRLAIAETLGLTVYWIEDTSDFDVAIVNSAARGWTTRDYAEKYAANGLKPYIEGLEFSDQYGIPIGITFAILGGSTKFGSVADDFHSGAFRIKDRPWADAVAGLYSPLTKMASVLGNASFLMACMAVCRVSGFEAQRLIQNASRCRDKLVSYSTRDAYLDMLEEIYNYHRAKMVGLKVEATMVMRDRSPLGVNGKPRKKKEAAA